MKVRVLLKKFNPWNHLVFGEGGLKGYLKSGIKIFKINVGKNTRPVYTLKFLSFFLCRFLHTIFVLCFFLCFSLFFRLCQLVSVDFTLKPNVWQCMAKLSFLLLPCTWWWNFGTMRNFSWTGFCVTLLTVLVCCCCLYFFVFFYCCFRCSHFDAIACTSFRHRLILCSVDVSPGEIYMC